jgi:acyl-CoA synthetase (AMP-forming)/AMP-acid ligase II
VMLRPGRTLDASHVLAHCRERLAQYKVPRQVVFVSELPLNPQGKVLKKDLRRAFLEGGAAAPSRPA